MDTTDKLSLPPSLNEVYEESYFFYALGLKYVLEHPSCVYDPHEHPTDALGWVFKHVVDKLRIEDYRKHFRYLRIKAGPNYDDKMIECWFSNEKFKLRYEYYYNFVKKRPNFLKDLVNIIYFKDCCEEE